MKKIFRTITTLALILLIASCEEDPVVFDNINGQTMLKFDESTSVPFSLEIGTTETLSLTLSSSVVSDVDRTVNLSVNEDLTTLPADAYNFDTNAVIPAGEYSTEVEFTITDTNLDFTQTFDLVLNLEGSSESLNLSIPEPTQTISVSITCPIPSDFMVGDYEIADVSGAIGPANGTSNFAPGVVTLEANGSTRTFTSQVLPAFNEEIENITINLNCDVFQIGDVDPSLACTSGVSYIFTATDRDDSSTYNVNGSDESFIINYIEDPEGSCGGPFISSFSLTKIN
ncbi:protein of unknown function [Psychroflexus salarius]|uniref:BT-3987-like N-terminal domain-containing protein n=1 Tax=Psychroflexus salarius TaxID=1155689 RepID=A0A1M4UB07_9FLAO|nr:DUF1735 domain-containing protein [Psychroflexus salarius]SHE53743.1 protein of unknown function [Psychroflexus salarius]